MILLDSHQLAMDRPREGLFNRSWNQREIAVILSVYHSKKVPQKSKTDITKKCKHREGACVLKSLQER